MSNKNSKNPFNDSPKKILLIEPPFYKLFGYERWHYPITLTLFEVKIYDADMPTKECKSLTRTETRKNYPLYGKALEEPSNPVWIEAKERLLDFNPDIVGITAITAKINSADKIASICKELFKDKTKVVLGGPHVKGISQSYPNWDFGPNYDFIIPEIPGLIKRKPNTKLLMDRKKYSSKNLTSILTSTGCPNACTFCCNSYDRKIIYREEFKVSEEIRELRQEFKDQDRIYLLDDCIFSNKNRLYEIGKIMNENKFKFAGGSRVMSLSKEKIENFMENGGDRVYLGIESGSQKILDKINKRLQIKEIKRRTKWLNEVNLPWTALLIAGFPFESLEDLKLTEELIYEIGPSFVSLNHFTPYPGTKIWGDYYDDSNLDFKNLFQLNPDSTVVKSEERKDYIEKMFEEFDEYNLKKMKGSINYESR